MTRAFFSACLTTLLVACSHPLDLQETPVPATTLYDYRIESSGGTPYSLNEFANTVSDADVILVGEWHTHPGIHLFQAQLLATLAERRPATALSMEQFSRPAQPVIDAYLNGDRGEHALTSYTGKWPNYASDYRPLVEVAKQQALPVIAANTTQDIVRCLSSKGEGYLDTLPADKRQHVARQLSSEASPYKEKFFSVMFHGDEEKTKNQYLAQIAWDDTMAESIVDFLATHPDFAVMHVAGAFHVEEGLGIASRIHQRNPDLKIVIISPQTEDDPLPNDVEDYRLIVKPLPEQWLSDEEMNAAIGKMRHSSRKSLNCE
ncbi:iron-regulated protein [Enterovibrio norvegicus]|uniref:ChaN family lipoprotein n=1 Tax=Enterovibrio norvegicus TaxID=188144 RepID=UPI000C82A569|nr:ChaN family lipoprotein [Enterovibrio norvegicus]MCC4798745.1 ChaN family lipoprotein [Enterovibrio norvegicus]PMI33459.1 iron-regulated protein [Enterovibrio norvegicus]PMI33692.1 iron-regulated protein [Enterovibrio norvegicus]PMN52235.1 iron-regulated protein [Enterovibrio norvegicus]TKF14679.1 iron-regulated protein [Enterovibrio norvegicus]